VCVLEQHEQHTRVRDIYVTSYIRSYMSSYVPDNAPFWRQEKMQMDPPLLARKSQLPTWTAANVDSCQAHAKHANGRNRPLPAAETCRRRAGEKSSSLPWHMALSDTGGSACHTDSTGVTRRRITTQATLDARSCPALLHARLKLAKRKNGQMGNVGINDRGLEAEDGGRVLYRERKLADGQKAGEQPKGPDVRSKRVLDAY